MKSLRIRGKIISKENKPKGELKEWLIKNDLDDDRYIVVDSPRFLVWYFSKENGLNLNNQFISVNDFDINKEEIDLKKLQGTRIFIFDMFEVNRTFCDYTVDNLDRLRIVSVYDDYDLRELKLRRIVEWQED